MRYYIGKKFVLNYKHVVTVTVVYHISCSFYQEHAMSVLAKSETEDNKQKSMNTRIQKNLEKDLPNEGMRGELK